ncbi:MAG: phosphopantetheine-binding protein [Chromatiaceae bacterium]|nr:phosphopantetheine-binding protein [Chromatiaceae bacterium]
MDENSLRGQIIESLTKVAPDVDQGVLDPDINFRDQFEIDSVDFLGFVLDLEKKLGIKIPEVDYPKLSGMSGCLTYLLPLLRAT